ncbi:MAG: response regulator [Pirellula sp.]|jgi:DNA-binding NarL/FixJ family response regulator
MKRDSLQRPIQLDRSNTPNDDIIRVLIADDHEIVREGIASCIESESGFEIVGRACNGREAVGLYDSLHPDVLLLDVQMPIMNGHEVLAELSTRKPPPKVIVITIFAGDETARRSIHGGALGYLLKDSPRRVIWDAIRQVAAGKRVIDESVLPALTQTMSKSPLTKREIEVLRLMASGCGNKEIGVQLSITEGTAKTHVFAIMEKLGASGRTEAVVIAARRGILELSSP